MNKLVLEYCAYAAYLEEYSDDKIEQFVSKEEQEKISNFLVEEIMKIGEDEFLELYRIRVREVIEELLNNHT